MSCRLRPAFTLIELMVVILLVAVMASIIVPAYSRFYAKAQFDNAARQVQDIFAYAHEQAILHDTSVTVSYDQQSHSFVAMVSPPTAQRGADLPVALSGGDSPDATVSQSGETTHHYQLDDSVTVGNFTVSGGSGGPGGGSQLHFQSDGSVEGATLTLLNVDGFQAQFQVWPATGRMTRQDTNTP